MTRLRFLSKQGAWQPSLNISTVLTSIGLLLSEPNPDDGLMCEASQEYKYNRQAFDQKARSMTQKYAKTELGGSHKSRIEVDDIVSIHPSGISGKLSLESSSSMTNRDNDGELNEMETKGKRKEVDINLDEGNLRQEKLCGSRRKLSLEYYSQMEKKIGHEKENVGANQSSFCKPLTTSMAPSGSNVPKHNICSQQIHNHHETGESINGSISRTSEQPLQFNRKKGSLDSSLVTDGNNEKIHIGSQLRPFHSHSKTSHGALLMEMPINGNELEPHKGFINRLGNGSTESICWRICRPGRKLSLGSKGSSQEQETDDKENVAHDQKPVPVSSPKSSSRNSRIGQKLSRAPFTQLQGSNESNSKLLSHSENLAIDSPMSLPSKQDLEFEHKQSTLHHDPDVSEETEQQKLEGLPLPEAIIVLDSEDSEEERDGALRSKLSLARKCRGKWRAKA